MTDSASDITTVDLGMSGGPLPIPISDTMVDAFGFGYDLVDAQGVRPIRPGTHRRMGLGQVIPNIQHHTFHVFAQVLADSVDDTAVGEGPDALTEEEREFYLKMAQVIASMGCAMFDEFLNEADEIREEAKIQIAKRPEPGGYL